MLRFAQAMLAAGLVWFVSGCCSMCQSPFDYTGPVQSGAVPSTNYVGRSGSVLTAENSVGLPPSGPTQVVEQASAPAAAQQLR